MSAKFIEFFKLNMSSSIYRPRSREKVYNLQLKHFFPKQQTHRHQLPPSLSTAISCRTETLIQQDWYKQKANPGFLENFIKVTDFYGTDFHLQRWITYSPCISDTAQRQLPLKTLTQSPANLMIWKLEMENRRFFFWRRYLYLLVERGCKWPEAQSEADRSASTFSLVFGSIH